MYRDIFFFNNGDMIFKHISNISIYITSVSHTLIYLWHLTSLNKHEHDTFGTGVLYECICEGNRLSLEKFRWHFHFI